MKHDRILQALQRFVDTDKYQYEDAPEGSSDEDRELVHKLVNDCALEIAAQYRQQTVARAVLLAQGDFPNNAQRSFFY